MALAFAVGQRVRGRARAARGFLGRFGVGTGEALEPLAGARQLFDRRAPQLQGRRDLAQQAAQTLGELLGILALLELADALEHERLPGDGAGLIAWMQPTDRRAQLREREQVANASLAQGTGRRGAAFGHAGRIAGLAARERPEQRDRSARQQPRPARELVVGVGHRGIVDKLTGGSKRPSRLEHSRRGSAVESR